MFDRVLVANRGEIAVRIIRTLRRLGVEAIAVYSDADEGALHVRMADRAVRIGPAAPGSSYLDVDAIIAAARSTDAQAIHPGYGFLSEDPRLAEACMTAGITFIGPSADAIRKLGDKQAARKLATPIGVPVLPAAPVDDPDGVAALGFPVMLKAAAGGGGRGMRVVEAIEKLATEAAAASREAEAAFGDGRIYAERLLTGARHIEVQILGDGRGDVIAFGERECTVQRRNQKVIEEAPSASIDDALRNRLIESAIRLGKAANYGNAGSVEFLVDAQAGEYYFLEVNTRLQVEHPVTESVFGVDLVALQLRVAAGEPLPAQPGAPRGHAIEFRVYAEDPSRDFRPDAGTVTSYAQPHGDGIRVDAGIDDRSAVPPAYDALLAKVVVSGSDRGTAIARSREALRFMRVGGFRTNTGLLEAIAADEDYASNHLDTGWLSRKLETLLDAAKAPATVVAALAAWDASGGWPTGGDGAWTRAGSWRMGRLAVRYTDGEADYNAVVDRANGGWLVQLARRSVEVVHDYGSFLADNQHVILVHDGDHAVATRGGARWTFARRSLPSPSSFAIPAGPGGATVTAPLNALVDRVLVTGGDTVEASQPLVVLSAMKMEHVVAAPGGGRVTDVLVRPGEQVVEGQELVRLS